MNYTFRVDVLNAFSHFQYLEEFSNQYNSAETLVQAVVCPMFEDPLSFSTAREYRSSYMATQETWEMLLHLDRSQGKAVRICD